MEKTLRGHLGCVLKLGLRGGFRKSGFSKIMCEGLE